MCIFSLFDRLFYSAFGNPKLLNLLSARPIVGNLILTSLVAATGFSIVRGVTENNISANKLCDSISGDVESNLDVKPDKLTWLSATNTLSDGDNDIVSCLYEFEKTSGSETKRFDVTYRVTDTALTANIDEAKITEKDFISICRDEAIYTRSDNINSPLDDDDIELSSSKDNKVYPAFRRRCEYTLPAKPELPSSLPDQQGDPIIVKIGIDLNNFCSKNYQDRKLTEAAFHFYDDSSSWYCTNPNITAGS